MSASHARPPAAPAIDAHDALLAGCEWCDALSRVRAGQAASCWRCGSPLHTSSSAARAEVASRLGAVVALLVAAWVCITVTHTEAMVSLALRGLESSVTLSGATVALWQQGKLALAAALFITTVAAPATEMAAMLLVAATLWWRARRPAPAGPLPRWLPPVLHLWQGMRDWNMTEILVLGTAVSLVKLGQMATLIVGPGLVALMAFMALRLAAMRWLSPVDAWSLLAPAEVRAT
ncbi:paraquat-inducible protein A [Aquincola sp. MAHUQ-54]|uniref:Paraquat-inducible protein A n=1 Tax=Aquincola agrisoli TaxID=3119538 RepID=A0AAW9QBI3_9BURK